MTITYPLQWPEGWPRARHRKGANFGKTESVYGQSGGSWKTKKQLSIADAVRRVNAELERLGVDVMNDSKISTNLRLNMVGLPRGNQGEPGDPGVAVYWQKRGQPMRVMAIDVYYRVADNMAAIAATLEAMRAIERHGGAQILERAFTGFAALPAPKRWHEILECARDASTETIETQFRALAKKHHPDLGGSAAEMADLNRAREEALRERSAA